MSEFQTPALDESPVPTVERLAIEEAPARRARPKSTSPVHRLFEATQPPESAPVTTAGAEPPAVVVSHTTTTLGVFRALAMVLSARALLLVFGLCGFAIAFVGALRESREILFVFIAWALLAIIPVIVLDVLTRRRE